MQDSDVSEAGADRHVASASGTVRKARKERVLQAAEIVLSIAMVVGLYTVGTVFEPTPRVEPVEPPAVQQRDRFYSGVALGDGDSVLWVVGQAGKILRSHDGGDTWRQQDSGTDQHLQSIAAWDKERAVAVGNSGTVLITKDGGRNWQSVAGSRGITSGKLLRVRIGPDGTAWAVGVFGAVFASSDYGGTWQRMMPERDVAWNDVGFSPDGRVWVVGEFGDVRRTASAFPDALEDQSAPEGPGTRRRVAWRDVEVPTDSSLMSVAFSSDGLALAVGLDGTLLRSDDAGGRWEMVELDTDEHIFDIDFLGRRWVGVGARGLVIRSESAEGVRWEVGRAAHGNYSWHTDALAASGQVLLVGEQLTRWGGESLIGASKTPRRNLHEDG